MEKDPLSELRDIHLPDPGGFWPPAPGWWLLAALALAGLGWCLWALYRRRQRNRWLIHALKELSQLARVQEPDLQWFNQLNRLLKRAARARFPERRPESLSGADWVAFLNETSPNPSKEDRALYTALVESSWRPRPDLNARAALSLTQQWLRGQRC
ncbi:DUF4381 domain-containing protein [Marinobacter caseinilyticus]|uniref:DUF4381 domain-containing protein n=1 Tax=Marinobacter caseinilyticus TaxID=2692195 RepID=UPI001409EBD0|nr:DUF4381 domain-containing protein [Marinobacter caseinilyticus]